MKFWQRFVKWCFLKKLFRVTSNFKRDVDLVGVREVFSNYSPSGTYILRLLSLAPKWKEQGFEILSKSVMKFFKGKRNIPFMKSLHQSWHLDSTPELPIFDQSENQFNIIFSFTVKIQASCPIGQLIYKVFKIVWIILCNCKSNGPRFQKWGEGN